MSRKSKGSNAERDLIHKFWEYRWAAVRVAGSGSNKYPSPDLVVGKDHTRFAIECKAVKERHKYFTKEEINDLRTFSEIFGAEALVAVKFNNLPWRFLKIEHLIEKNKSFFVDFNQLTKIGVLFEELIQHQP